MPTPNIPADFDFLDPDVNLAGLPVAELAELRKSEPIHWVDVPGGTGGFEDKGYWLVTKHADVKEVSRRSDVFSSWQNGAIPIWPQGDDARDRSSCSAAVMLNMDAPHHTRLRKIISRGFTPRAIGRLEEELAQRAQNIAKTAAAEGSGDFVEQVSCELPLQAIAGLLGVPQEDRDKLFRWSNEMTGGEDPEYADVDPAQSSMELIMYAMAMAEERGKNPTDDIVTTLIQADVDGEKLSDDEFGFFVIMLAVAGNETTRNSITHGMIAFASNPDQWELYKKERPDDRGRRDHPLGHAGVGVPAHRQRGHRAGRRADQEGPAGGDVLPLGQLRRRGLRGSAHLQHPARPEPARRFRRHRRALLHRRQPGADDDQPDLQRRRRPHARSQADRRARAATCRGGSTASSTGRSTTPAPASRQRARARSPIGSRRIRVDFSPDEGQQAVADVVTSVLERDNSWDALVAGGVTAFGVPERLGGDGVGLAEIATALTEIGRHGTISPALATLGLGTAVLLDLASDDTAGPLPRRRRQGFGPDGGAQRAGRAAAGPAAPRRSPAAKLNGTKVAVPYAEQAEWIVVTTDSAVVVVSPKADGVQVTKTPTSNKADEYTVTFSDAEADGSAGGRPGAPGESVGAGGDWRVRIRSRRGCAAADRRLRGQPPSVRQAAFDVPDGRRTARGGLHRLAHTDIGGDVGRVAARRGA